MVRVSTALWSSRKSNSLLVIHCRGEIYSFIVERSASNSRRNSLFFLRRRRVLAREREWPGLACRSRGGWLSGRLFRLSGLSYLFLATMSMMDLSWCWEKLTSLVGDQRNPTSWRGSTWGSTRRQRPTGTWTLHDNTRKIPRDTFCTITKTSRSP